MLREQTITPRAGRGSGRGRGGDFEQRPQRRASKNRAKEQRERNGNGGALARTTWRWLIARWRLVSKLALAILIGVMFFATYRAAASASFFQVKEIDVEGVSRANSGEIKTIVKRMVAPSGVWRADLEAVSATIKRQQTWVRDVSISRVLPSGVRVRVTERVPEAVVRSSSGRLVWVDAAGVILGAASNFGAEANTNKNASSLPPMPAFLIRGWDESEGVEARAENKERVTAYREMLSAWTKLGIAERVSEVNLQDLRDVRAQLAGDDAQIEVRLGREKFGERLERALNVLAGIKNNPNYTSGSINYLNATQLGRIIAGSGSGAQTSNGASKSDENDTADTSKGTANATNVNTKSVNVTKPEVKVARPNESRMTSATKNHRTLTNESSLMNHKTTNASSNNSGAERPRRITQR